MRRVEVQQTIEEVVAQYQAMQKAEQASGAKEVARQLGMTLSPRRVTRLTQQYYKERIMRQQAQAAAQQAQAGGQAG